MKIVLLLLLVGGSALGVSQAKFDQWKTEYVAKWGKREVPRSFMKKTLADVTYDPRVVEIDRNQVTSRKTPNYPEWMKDWVESEPHRIREGQRLLKKHAALLSKVEKKYGVDREAIIALWGVETLYGSNTGKYDVIRTLSTLTFDGRRRKFFEVQLFTALKILHRGHVTRENFKGSWSGALGHCQFMPSSFTRLAQDMDGDGKKDIWGSLPDVMASIANYLKNAKWKKGQPVGHFIYGTGGKGFRPGKVRTAAQYRRLGFTGPGGAPLKGNWKGKAEEIPFANSPYIVRGPNYMPVMRWNNSSLFAAFVVTLMEPFTLVDSAPRLGRK